MRQTFRNDERETVLGKELRYKYREFRLQQGKHHNRRSKYVKEKKMNGFVIHISSQIFVDPQY